MSRLVIGRRAGDFDALGTEDGDIRVAAGAPGEAVRTIADYVPDGHRTADLEAVHWLKALAQAPVGGGPSLHERLRFGGTSLWWFMEGELYRQAFKDISRWVTWISAAIDRETPSALAIVDDGSPAAGAALATARAAGLRTVAVPGERAAARGAGPWVSLANRGRDTLRRWAARPSRKRLGARPRILAASMAREQVSVDLATGARVPEDLVLAPVLDELARREGSVTQLYKFPYRGRVRVPAGLRARRDVLPWEAYAGRESSRAMARQAAALDYAWRRLSSDPAFAHAWTYAGVPLWDVLAPTLAEVWRRNGRLATRYLLLAERVLDAVQPDVVLVASETSIDNKALLVRANQRGVPIVAVQHGTILAADDYLVDYSHTQAELDAEVSKSRLYATAVCLFGDQERRVMVDNIGYAYPERLFALGQPRFDALSKPASAQEREAFCRAFSLDPARRTVLIGSQTFNIAGNKDQFFEAVLGALRNASDLQIVVKPHPIESTAYHRAIAKRVGVATTVLPANVDMQQAIRACDVLLTSYSTVAVEAMLAGKPVVTVNLTGLPDIVPYAREGSAMGAYSAGEVLPAVLSALDDADARAKLLGAADAYLAREMAARDGAATARVVDTALDLALAHVTGPEKGASGG